jgi:hypothetical protein
MPSYAEMLRSEPFAKVNKSGKPKPKKGLSARKSEQYFAPVPSNTLGLRNATGIGTDAKPVDVSYARIFKSQPLTIAPGPDRMERCFRHSNSLPAELAKHDFMSMFRY